MINVMNLYLHQIAADKRCAARSAGLAMDVHGAISRCGRRQRLGR